MPLNRLTRYENTVNDAGTLYRQYFNYAALAELYNFASHQLPNIYQLVLNHQCLLIKIRNET